MCFVYTDMCACICVFENICVVIAYVALSVHVSVIMCYCGMCIYVHVHMCKLWYVYIIIWRRRVKCFGLEKLTPSSDCACLTAPTVLATVN